MVHAASGRPAARRGALAALALPSSELRVLQRSHGRGVERCLIVGAPCAPMVAVAASDGTGGLEGQIHLPARFAWWVPFPLGEPRWRWRCG